MDHFQYRDGILYAEDVAIPDIAAAVGTPFYCYSTATLTRHYNVFTEALAGLPALVCYSVKANSNLAVIKTLAGLGAGVDVVYDSIGKDTFMDSLDCLKPLGMMVTFGNATGPVDPFSPGLLAQKGSLFITRPTLFTYMAKREDLMAMAADLFEVVSSGVVKIEINQTYDLKDTAQAHTDLEARKTTGSTILKP